MVCIHRNQGIRHCRNSPLGGTGALTWQLENAKIAPLYARSLERIRVDPYMHVQLESVSQTVTVTIS